MSYRRRTYYQKSNYRNQIGNSVQNDGNSFNVFDFLRSEFFNASDETFYSIAKFYSENYGSGAYNYMLNTYNSWKNGTTSISAITMSRILECVPKFLSVEKRLYILRCEIHIFLEKAKSKITTANIENLNSGYKLLQTEVINFNQSNLQWFIGKGIFNQDQIEHYLIACKYAINERLLQSYRQTLNDLIIIKSKFSSIKSHITSFHYTIDFLDLKFDISAIQKYVIVDARLKTLPNELDKSFKEYGERYMLEELMKMSFYDKQGMVNALIKANDIDLFISHFNELIKQPNEITMTSEFKGEGGVCSVVLEYTPLRKSINGILISSLKIITIVGGAYLVIAFIIMSNKQWLLYFCFYGVFYLIAALIQEVKKISKAIKQIKQHG